MKKIIIGFCAVFLLIFSVANIWGKGWILYHDGPYKGKVVDADTGQPVEGAAVVGVWSLRLYGGPAGPLEPYCDAQETVTDKNGEFTVPKAFCFNLWPFTKIDMAEFVIFKPGYLAYPPVGATFEERKTNMPSFTGEEFRSKEQYNIIKLGKTKIRKKRELTLSDAEIPFLYNKAKKKLPILLKLTNEESKALGLGERPSTGGQK